jgi:hypothetical protein
MTPSKPCHHGKQGYLASARRKDDRLRRMRAENSPGDAFQRFKALE